MSAGGRAGGTLQAGWSESSQGGPQPQHLPPETGQPRQAQEWRSKVSFSLHFRGMRRPPCSETAEFLQPTSLEETQPKKVHLSHGIFPAWPIHSLRAPVLQIHDLCVCVSMCASAHTWATQTPEGLGQFLTCLHPCWYSTPHPQQHLILVERLSSQLWKLHDLEISF